MALRGHGRHLAAGLRALACVGLALGALVLQARLLRVRMPRVLLRALRALCALLALQRGVRGRLALGLQALARGVLALTPLLLVPAAGWWCLRVRGPPRQRLRPERRPPQLRPWRPLGKRRGLRLLLPRLPSSSLCV